MNNDTLKQIRKKAEQWLDNRYDEETREEVRRMLDRDEDALVEAFYKDLEFGTGGMRGIMGAGTNRMNIYTVGMSTQGLANYLIKQFGGQKDPIRVAIAHDSRNNSKLFARTAAEIFAANNIRVYLFDDLRPTPELSFAIRHFKCQSGVVVTASHNPREYNGYKVYWEDGAQVIEPHDRNIIEEVQRIRDISEVKTGGPVKHIHIIGREVDNAYISRVKELSLDPAVIKRNHDLRIVYTPLHGSGVKLVPMALRKFGFTCIFNVPEQDIPDGNFPTVRSPNPEEQSALEMAVRRASEVNGELVMATDPDTDRLGVAIKDQHGDYLLLNGNQTATLLTWYLLMKWSEKGLLKGNEYIVKTIVTTELLTEIADKYGVKHYDVLTGFKFIADIILKMEGKQKYIGGGEESYGYLAGDFVRDKDAVSACALIAECAAWARDREKTLFDVLLDIYTEYGLYKEVQISLYKEGKTGSEEIQKMMERFRTSPPESINNSNVMLVHDYLSSKTYDLISHLKYDIRLPKSNVLQFILHDNTKISIRPSGTEPKIKFYIGVKEKMKGREDFGRVNRLLDERITNIKSFLNITS